MNKEQKKPQEECSYVTTTEHRGNPCKKEEKLQSQEDLEKEIQHYFQEYEISKAIVLTRIYVKANFIAKRDLRKLLEEKKRVMAHIVGAKRVETPYVIIADILAEIEKI